MQPGGNSIVTKKGMRQRGGGEPKRKEGLTGFQVDGPHNHKDWTAAITKHVTRPIEEYDVSILMLSLFLVCPAALAPSCDTQREREKHKIGSRAKRCQIVMVTSVVVVGHQISGAIPTRD